MLRMNMHAYLTAKCLLKTIATSGTYLQSLYIVFDSRRSSEQKLKRETWWTIYPAIQ
jgi:hypothetical protein